jgi:hypothetical protein
LRYRENPQSRQETAQSSDIYHWASGIVHVKMRRISKGALPRLNEKCERAMRNANANCSMSLIFS